MLEPDASFCLTVNHFKSSVQGQQNDSTWFKAQPMGVNKLNRILTDMCKVGGIPQKTNHAIRKTLSTSSVHENQLQTMFNGNRISAGVFNITMASSQSAMGSPESEPSKRKFRPVICIESESRSSQEN